MGGLRPRAGVLSRLSITERIQESNCCVPRSICRCCNAMMVRIESHMQQPRSVLSRNLFRFGIPPDSFRIDEAVTNRSSLKPLRSRQNDHLLGSWVEHAKAVAEVEYRAKSAHGKLRHPSLKT